jgi:hypothetical protein
MMQAIAKIGNRHLQTAAKKNDTPAPCNVTLPLFPGPL